MIQNWPLEDWVFLLHDAKSKMESLDYYKDSSLTVDTSQENALTTTKPDLPPPLKLIKGLFLLSRHKESVNVLTNIQIAALHLSYMFRSAANRDNRVAGFFFILVRCHS
jgi:hypothetical protein